MHTKNFLLLLLLVSGSIFSQSLNKLKKQALRDAKVYAKASKNQDINTLIDYTHPKIFKKYGREQLENDFDQEFRTMTAQKIKVVSSKIEEITEIRKEKKQYHCLAQNTIKMDFNGRRVIFKSSLFGFYDKKKQSWYFIESNKLFDDPKLTSIFRNFKTNIEIPQDEQIADF